MFVEGGVGGLADLVVLESSAEQVAVEPAAGDFWLKPGELGGSLAGKCEDGFGITRLAYRLVGGGSRKV